MKIKANIDLREYAKSKGVLLWEVAEKLGYIDSNFSRKLRKEFAETEKVAFCRAVDQIAERKGAENEEKP